MMKIKTFATYVCVASRMVDDSPEAWFLLSRITPKLLAAMDEMKHVAHGVLGRIVVGLLAVLVAQELTSVVAQDLARHKRLGGYDPTTTTLESFYLLEAWPLLGHDQLADFRRLNRSIIWVSL